MFGGRTIKLWPFSALGDLTRSSSLLLPRLLDYSGEFGPELVLFLPFCNWLSKEGSLKNRRIRTYRGMRCFYDDLDCKEIIEKTEPRRFVPSQDRPRWLPARDEHSFDGLGRPSRHLYPDLRGKFRKLPLLADLGADPRPLLIIHNKHNDEWDDGPVNHISLATLNQLFVALRHEYTIVYIRHGMAAKDDGFSDDHNTPQFLDDRRLLDRHPEVRCFDDLHAAHRKAGGADDVNTFKNILYSRCHRFISSQGGGAHQIALFSGSLLVVLHRRGSEERWAYGDGYYGFMAAVPPIRAICRTEEDLVRALPLFAGAAAGEDRVLLSAASAPLLAQFSPWTIASRLA